MFPAHAGMIRFRYAATDRQNVFPAHAGMIRRFRDARASAGVFPAHAGMIRLESAKGGPSFVCEVFPAHAGMIRYPGPFRFLGDDYPGPFRFLEQGCSPLTRG